MSKTRLEDGITNLFGEVKQIANLTDMLEYNISQPYELVNPWDICDWRFLVDKRDDMFTPDEIRKYYCK